ncbi:MAG: ribonuclease III family protein [Candidatus Bathyarchaeia archaeon]|nr:ribonuclease III family protein [Candidatus Bathyarchaeia archaeon]MDI6904148.1 ribonuclease III family protein [Candidatus Bathyarchaeia archaeon]
MKKRGKTFSFIKTHRNLAEVLTDHKLASLGDTYINFVYSLALSNRRGKPSGAKVKGGVLAEAVKKAGLRGYMPSRMTRHMLADAAEALIVYAWLYNYITLEESVAMLEKTDDSVEGFSQLLATIKGRIKFF